MKNLYDIKELLGNEEVFETILQSDNIRIERIVSNGKVSPEGFWFDQEDDEWVFLMQGEAIIEFEDGREEKMKSGNHLLIPAHQKHRVKAVSSEPNCTWLAVHGKFL